MTESNRDKWNRRHGDTHLPRPPCAVLAEQAGYLPPAGRALDAACGLGGNAVFLAQRGLHCCAWDLADTAIDRLGRYAHQHGLTITAERRDLLLQPPTPKSFEVIVVSYFLERTLLPILADALTPGGRIFYQTFVRSPTSNSGPSNPRFVLEKDELLSHFSGLTLGYYEERQVQSTPGQHASLALFVGQRPTA